MPQRCPPSRRAVAGRALIVLAALILAAATPAAGEPAPSFPTPAAPPPSCPASLAQQSAQHRFLEAQTKARLHAKLAEAAAAATPNMLQYDVHHYDLQLALDPVARVLSGTVTVGAWITGAAISTMDLDLAGGMVVSAVAVEGAPATFTRPTNLVTVDLGRLYQPGEKVSVAVTYAGNPAGSAFGWNSYNGSPLIWTLSEPYGARTWWPCKDLNTDKADSVDLRVTVPSGLIVASNGLLAAEIDHGATTTYDWRHRYPIATYLVSLAIHPYAKFTHWYPPLAGGDPMPVDYYVVPDRLTTAMTAYQPTVPMLQAFAQGFGEYPFVAEKYGHAHFPWGGGMEHQTLTSLGLNGWSAWLIAHELAHQWWGDLITCATFHHIWLNEGFATWAEAYWREQSEGEAAYREEMDNAVYYGPGTIYVENPSNFSEIFDYNLSYLKASWVVHMLRGVLGDADFFAALQAYRQAYDYGSATTEQFRDVCESVSGRDLDAFFAQWIYAEYYPVYEYRYYFLPAGGGTTVKLRIRQVQTNTGLFKMPLRVGVFTSGGWVDVTVENDQWDQAYSFDVPGTALLVELDRHGWVLKGATGGLTDAPALPPPAALRLGPNHPNPFNPATLIPFELPRAGRARLTVHDAAGRLVRQLIDAELPAGQHTARWDGAGRDGRPAAAGIYFARLSAGGDAATRGLTLAR